MHELLESIRMHGVLNLAIARLRGDGTFELISGHRRRAVCKSLGFETMPVVVLELSDDEATVLVVAYNVQREHLLPSEKAKLPLNKARRMKELHEEASWMNRPSSPS